MPLFANLPDQASISPSTSAPTTCNKNHDDHERYEPAMFTALPTMLFFQLAANSSSSSSKNNYNNNQKQAWQKESPRLQKVLRS
jgi:hypothetical protein